MPSNATSAGRKSRSVVTRAVMAVVLLGVVLGAWRYLGRGAPIWELQTWFKNSQLTIREFSDAVMSLFNSAETRNP